MAGLPTLYKKNQGQVIRSITALCLAVIMAAICYYIFTMLAVLVPDRSPREQGTGQAIGWRLAEDIKGGQQVLFAKGTDIDAAMAANLQKEQITKVLVVNPKGFTYAWYLWYGLPVLIFLAGAVGIFWAVNHPKFADFLIATESEMKKVSWSSKQELIGSTTAVIITIIVLGGIIYVGDLLIIKGLSVLKVFN